MARMVRMLIVPMLAFLLAGCATAPSQPPGDVAIYMPREEMSGRDILAADLGTLPLQPEPVIAAAEIVSYSASSHDLTLTPAAIARLAGFDVPVQGRGFVLCRGSRPLFAGAFWTSISSLSFDGLTINVPFERHETSLHLYSGYPMRDDPLPNDPRDDPRLLEAFRQAGKLR